jgi:hypothetical protein
MERLFVAHASACCVEIHLDILIEARQHGALLKFLPNRDPQGVRSGVAFCEIILRNAIRNRDSPCCGSHRGANACAPGQIGLG